MDPRFRLLATTIFGLWLGSCAGGGYVRFDSIEYLRDRIGDRVGPEAAREIRIPFELDSELEALVEERFPAVGGEEWRVEQILDFIFRKLDLRYQRLPTRSAVETFHAREANCLSFVNLFVGIARAARLNPFYVEVRDYRKWNYHQGLVISHGHIVAGLRVEGKLRTFDFLPYRPKSYRDFEPIDDLTATAHYYNNLGAEALLRGDLEEAEQHLERATRLAPHFTKAVNNLGVLYLRTDRNFEATELLREGLEGSPDDVGLLTNLARAHQDRGRAEEAEALMSRLDALQHTNPFYFVYRGDMALAEGDPSGALEYMAKALRRDSEVPEVHLGLVRVYLALGELGKAEHHLERALTLDATHEEARRYVTMLQGLRAEEAGP
ncbi:MAG: tetratricopeptide repeat protein [Thermoanaerobaculia bacterium]|nr:tetratricopeptide repeat protein [Thermoanaerobaculia bacterium]